MDDTEAMPAVERAAQRPATGTRTARPPNLRSAAVVAGTLFALLFVVWTQRQIATLHAEVREARSAAAAANRSAAEATLAARAAQSALASSQMQTDPDTQPTDAPDDDSP